MIRRPSTATVIACVALFFSLAGTASANPTFALRVQRFSFSVGTTERFVRLPRRLLHAPNLVVGIDGNYHVAWFYDDLVKRGNAGYDLYGNGVAMRFFMRHRTPWVVAVGLGGRKRIGFRYWF